MWSHGLKEKCDELEHTRKAYIVYGSITSSNTIRTLDFTLSVCDNTCKDKTEKGEEVPYHIFQRCACGMDNCTVVYEDGSINDRPKYLTSCNGGWSDDDHYWGWSEGDSICVDYMNFSRATKHINKYDSNLNLVSSTTPKRVDIYNEELVLCEGRNATDGTAILNSDYVGNISYYDNHAEAITNNRSKLITVDSGRTSTFMEGIDDFYMYLLQIPGSSFPLGAMCMYIVNANPMGTDSNGYLQEQVWSLTFTTTSDKVIGGEDDGKCALAEFTCDIYKAPLGYKYTDRITGTHRRDITPCDE